MRSMTAYGRCSKVTDSGRWLIELMSVNKKSLDFSMYLPSGLLQFDWEVRKWVSSTIKRGQITVRVTLDRADLPVESVKAMISLKKKMEKACREMDLDPGQISFPFLYEEVKALANPESDRAQMREELKSGVEEALVELISMKQTEGAALSDFFAQRLEEIRGIAGELKKKSEGVADRYRSKILQKLSLLKSIVPEDDERILREAFLCAQKMDITEEIDRLDSHIGQFYAFMRAEEAGVGRSLDFLIQEMAREANTMASKVDEIELSHLALQIKAGVEKMREQVQNIE